MSANIIHLPQSIFPAKGKLDDIIFHNYSTQASSYKDKCILSKNAISLVISGEKTMHFADKTVEIKDDEFHFLSSGNCIVSMNLSEKKLFKSILIFFDDRVLTNFNLKYNSRIAKFKSNHKVGNELYIAFKKDAFVLNFIASLNLLFESATEISPEMKLLKFEELMLHLLEKHPSQFLSFQTSKANYPEEFIIRRAVETNVASNVTVEELAFLSNLSLSTFKRHFAKIYRTSPNKWLLQRRMEMARELLQHHQEKPSEVYYKVGYENHSSFSKTFKQSFGITPKQFHQEHLNVQR
jgi:AraC family transcriptional regulator, exoenzyme S synthesis regulatory protein ExsA